MEPVNILFQVLFYTVFALAICFVIRRFFKAGNSGGCSDTRLDRNTLIKIVAIVLVSRLALMLLCWAASHLTGNGKDFLDIWHQWDAKQYTVIADSGYYNAEEGWAKIVFYPLYPLTVWAFKWAFVDTRLAAMLVSWACLSGACVYLYKLVLLDWDKKHAFRAVKYLLIFPVTVFLGAPFTESMFLWLSLACLYYARVRRFRVACVLGMLAALTRNVGVLLVVPVFIEMLYANGLNKVGNWKHGLKGALKELSLILIIPLGTVFYLFMNHLITGDAFYFLQMSKKYWSQEMGSYANTLKVTFSRIMSDDVLRNKLTLWGTQLAVLLIGGLTLPVICKKMRASYGAYAIVYIFFIFAPTWLLSGFRYYMALAVLYPALAVLTKHEWVDIVLTTLFLLLMPLYSYAFSVGWLLM